MEPDSPDGGGGAQAGSGSGSGSVSGSGLGSGSGAGAGTGAGAGATTDGIIPAVPPLDRCCCGCNAVVDASWHHKCLSGRPVFMRDCLIIAEEPENDSCNHVAWCRRCNPVTEVV